LEEEQQVELACGHRHADPETGVKMVEFHVDNHHSLQDEMNATTEFGGNLSVQKDPNKKPLVCLGQDECIMKQFCFTNKSWTAPDGKTPLIPKDEGTNLTQAQLQRVNQCRTGKKHRDDEAAKLRRGNANKKTWGAHHLLWNSNMESIQTWSFKWRIPLTSSECSTGKCATIFFCLIIPVGTTENAWMGFLSPMA
jgi:hypothetical protein